ncbi:CynX/NimT family MFS transporter [Actinophytocola sp.]|uniref:CynX/NimT family MFS transporter n=1 Tax=Actinophytocola sp. TaxID=1872138 RepID=UPI003D6BCEFC
MRTAKERRAGLSMGLLVVGFLLVAANMRGALTSVGPLLDTIRRDIGLTAGEAGFIGTLPLLTFSAVSPQVPRLARRFGIDLMLWLAMAALATGIVLRSLPVVGLLWVGTVLLGAAIAVANVLLPSMIKRDFPDRIGAVTGVYTAVIGVVASTAAGVAVPLAGVLPGGWRTSLGIWAGFALIALAAWTPQLRRPDRDQAVEPGLDTRRPRAPWRSPLAWEVSAFMALSACGFYTMLAWFPSIVVSTGASEEYAGWMLFVYQILGVVMSGAVPLLLPKLADQRPVAAGGALLAMFGYLGLLIAPGLPLLWAVVTGVGMGTLFFLALAFFSLRAADSRSSASLAGMGQSIGYLFAATGPVAVGALHDATGGWRVPLAVLAVVAAVHTVVGWRAGRDAHVVA